MKWNAVTTFATMRTAVGERLRLALPMAIHPHEAAGEAAQARAVAVAPWHAVVRQATAMWAVTRVAYLLVTYFAVLLVAAGTAVNYSPGAIGFVSMPQALIQSWNRWDTVHYLDIAAHGYATVEQSAFFPLYPLLIGVVTFVLGSANRLLAALLVSNLAALAAFIAVGLLAAGEDLDDAKESGIRAIRVLAAFPLAFFLTAAYTDGLFLALAAFTLFFARRGAWRWAILCGFLAGLTRLTSIALILPLVWEYGRQHDWHKGGWRIQLRAFGAIGEAALVAVAVPAGVGVYLAYLWQRFGNPFILLRAEQLYWSHVNMTPVEALYVGLAKFQRIPFWSYWQARTLVDLAPLLIVLALAVVVAKRMPVAFTLYLAAVLYLAISAPIPHRPDIFASAGRYMLAAAPIFLLLGRWTKGRPWLDLLLVSGGFMVQALLAASFLTGYWIV